MEKDEAPSYHNLPRCTMDDNEKLTAYMEDYRELIGSLSDQMREALVQIPSVILDMARDYTQHNDINIFFMEVHSAIFALAHDCPEDFCEVAQWWFKHAEDFDKLLNTL